MENKNQFEPKFGECEKFYPLTTKESILPTKAFFMLYSNGGMLFCEKTTNHDKLGLRFYAINGDWYGRLKPDLTLRVEYTKSEHVGWKLAWESENSHFSNYESAIDYVKRGLKHYYE